MNIALSKATRQLLSIARTIALSLGCDFISTVHIFLAYYKFSAGENGHFTRGQFEDHFPIAYLLPTPLHYHSFLDRYRTGPAIETNNDIPLCTATQHSVNYSKCIASVLKSHEVEPPHLILGIMKCPDTDLNQLVNITDKTIDGLQAYYEKQQLLPENSFGIFKKMRIAIAYRQI